MDQARLRKLTEAYRIALSEGNIVAQYEILWIAERYPLLYEQLAVIEREIYTGKFEYRIDENWLVTNIEKSAKIQRILDRVNTILFKRKKLLRIFFLIGLIVSLLSFGVSCYQLRDTNLSSFDSDWVFTAVISLGIFCVIVTTSLWERSDAI